MGSDVIKDVGARRNSLRVVRKIVVTHVDFEKTGGVSKIEIKSPKKTAYFF